MSYQKTYTLRVGKRSVRTQAGKRYHVAVPHGKVEHRLKTTKRTDHRPSVEKEIRRLQRHFDADEIYIFDCGRHVETVIRGL